MSNEHTLFFYTFLVNYLFLSMISIDVFYQLSDEYFLRSHSIFTYTQLMKESKLLLYFFCSQLIVKNLCLHEEEYEYLNSMMLVP